MIVKRDGQTVTFCCDRMMNEICRLQEPIFRVDLFQAPINPVFFRYKNSEIDFCPYCGAEAEEK